MNENTILLSLVGVRNNCSTLSAEEHLIKHHAVFHRAITVSSPRQVIRIPGIAFGIFMKRCKMTAKSKICVCVTRLLRRLISEGLNYVNRIKTHVVNGHEHSFHFSLCLPVDFQAFNVSADQADGATDHLSFN